MPDFIPSHCVCQIVPESTYCGDGLFEVWVLDRKGLLDSPKKIGFHNHIQALMWAKAHCKSSAVVINKNIWQSE